MENVSSTASEKAMQHARELETLEAEMKDVFAEADASGDGMISKGEWREAIVKGKLTHFMDLNGFSKNDMQEYFSFLSRKSADRKVHIDDFLKGCMLFKGQASNFQMALL